MNNEMNNLYEFGEFRFDSKKQKLWRESNLVLLSPKASELLELLLEKKGEYISKEEIFEKVWAGTFVEDGVLTQNIYTLRAIDRERYIAELRKSPQTLRAAGIGCGAAYVRPSGSARFV